MSVFEQTLKRDGPVILDGGLATQLESMGFDIRGDLWSASLLARGPRAIVEAHRAYLDAGAECITSASYQASSAGFMSQGYSRVESDHLVASAAELALTAREEFLAENPNVEFRPLVAASVGPYGATMHDGSEYTGNYNVSDDDLRHFHSERLQLLDSGGADVLAVETIPNLREAEILCDLLEAVVTPVWVSFCCRDEQSISDGTPLRTAAALFANHTRVLATGVNCTSPRFISPLIEEIKAAAPDKAIVVYPNSGEMYHSAENSWSGKPCDLDADFTVNAWRAAGAKLIGGCCRTSPEDIGRIRRRLTE